MPLLNIDAAMPLKVRTLSSCTHEILSGCESSGANMIAINVVIASNPKTLRVCSGTFLRFEIPAKRKKVESLSCVKKEVFDRFEQITERIIALADIFGRLIQLGVMRTYEG